MATVTGRLRLDQDRAVRRRAAILEAAVSLVVRSGMSAISHRHVAREANVPLGAIRYYFETREALLLACIDELEVARSGTAEAAIEAAPEACGSAERTGLLLLRAYYGPDLSDEALSGTIGWIADCARESPALSARLVQLRHRVDDELQRLLDAAGRPDVPASLAGAVIDGAIFTATAESRTDIAGHAIAEFCALLRFNQNQT